ncbi:AGAP002165-PA-like protein [Anopheles sinensis]|uniref:AGAP002165-PA-like protein n=1 Tax=Anopheles sinensis TaxID=74873 RepID=A0A084VCU6_ANOSI|nr:AGAP002165-PA-like protein [Anopheles sinensis]
MHTSLGANLPSGVVHHPIYPDKMLDDSLYVSQGASPPPHLTSLQNSSSPHGGSGVGGGGGGGGGGGSNGGSTPMVNQLLKRAAVAFRRERINSSHSDEMALKRHRMSVDSNGPTSNRDPDVICNTPQTTATDFSSSASKQGINLPSPQGKDQLRQQDSSVGHPNSGNNSFSINSSSNLIKSSINNNNNNINNNNNLNNNLLHSKENSGGGGGGGGVCGSGSMPTSLGTSNGSNAGSLCSAEKESLASSPSERSAEDVKSEPLELLCGTGGDHENSSDSVTDDHGDLGKSGLDVKGSLRSPNDHDLDSNMHHHSGAQFLMNASENKLFQTPPSFNFSMAALAADPSALAGFNPQALQAVELAGSPQAGPQGSPSASSSSAVSPSPLMPLRMPPPTSGGINEPQECPYCRRTFSCYYSLKRHFQDKHEQSDTLYVCEFCHRRYRTKNSLTTHKSLQHRGSSGMLKRLLKTSAIKTVLSGNGSNVGAGLHGSHPHAHPHLFDFAAELGQPPPGIQYPAETLISNAIERFPRTYIQHHHQRQMWCERHSAKLRRRRKVHIKTTNTRSTINRARLICRQLSSATGNDALVGL